MPSFATPSIVVRPPSGLGQSMTFGSGAFRREVDRARAVPVERDAGFLGGDERLHGRDHVAAGEEMRLDLIDGDVDARLLRGDARIGDERVGDLAEPHGEEVHHADGCTGEPRAQPDAEE
jgi:hypothetical protein